jgi:hypothetical protein
MQSASSSTSGGVTTFGDAAMTKTMSVDFTFITLVADMRRQQRAYFNKDNAHRKESLLQAAKTAERQVDAYLDRIQSAYAALEKARQDADH